MTFFYCLLPSTAAVQAKDVCNTFLFVGDLNIHHHEGVVGSTTMELNHLTSQLSAVAIS